MASRRKAPQRRTTYQSTLDALEQVAIDETYKIGKRDAKRNRAPLLQYVYNRIVSTTDDDTTDDWTDDMRRAYLDGYNDGGSEMGWW